MIYIPDWFLQLIAFSSSSAFWYYTLAYVIQGKAERYPFCVYILLSWAALVTLSQVSSFFATDPLGFTLSLFPFLLSFVLLYYLLSCLFRVLGG